jgi:arabinosaccharide transport system substrate-binding protein
MRYLGPILPVMIALAVLTGGVISLRPARRETDYTVWVFSDTHAASMREPAGGAPPITEQFRSRFGKTVGVEQLGYRALEIRLLSMMLSPDFKGEVPDVVAIDITSVGKFFRAPVEEVGLHPLNHFLERSGWRSRILDSRFAPYSKQGVIFGVPYDVHPVAIAYRADLFAQAGVNLESASTWPEFHDLCLQYQRFWHANGRPDARALELPASGVEWLLAMLMQRGVNAIDDRDHLHLTDPRFANTIAFYATIYAGERGIATAPSGGGQSYRDLTEGRIGAWFCADWRPPQLQKYAASLSGKLRLMPLPRFDPTDAPTATWGGTMFGIPRACKHPEEAWRVLEEMVLAEPTFAARRASSTILPPIIERWNDPAYHQPDPFFGGQRVMELYVELARQTPVRYVTPFTILAQFELQIVVDQTVADVVAGRTDRLEQRVAGRLVVAQERLKRYIDFARFEESK